ncbi:polysaccharide deacetylase family protein [Kitasatospora sp. NPDC093806]|uniref:polysaccharide deacetylase family protein n=1 Tax=Kitasatospora sp. NPDC093806 TaxID=3155075 RepID=UPI00342E8F7F
MHPLRATLTPFRATLLATLATFATLLGPCAAAGPVSLTGSAATAAAPGAPGPPAALLGEEVRLLPVRDRAVALTFNAAWDETGLASVLDTLRESAAPAAFFPTGRFAEEHADAVRTIADAGHGLGNHSHSHPHFTGLAPEEARAEVLRADAAIRRASGAEPLPFFRFPYSETTPEAITQVNALGFADLEFTTDTNGYLGPSRGMTVDRVVERALAALAPGAILQLHVGSSEDAPPAERHCLDAEALPRVIDAVRAAGYRVLDLRELLTAG